MTARWEVMCLMGYFQTKPKAVILGVANSKCVQCCEGTAITKLATTST